MISTLNLEQAKKLISKEKKPIIVKAQDSEFNRKILEYGKFDILLSPEKSKGKDAVKYLASGLNLIAAKLAAKNKISIGIDLNEIRSLDKKDKAFTLARIKQNIKICRKAKCKFVLLNVKDKRDAEAFLLSLGASTQQASEGVK